MTTYADIAIIFLLEQQGNKIIDENDCNFRERSSVFLFSFSVRSRRYGIDVNAIGEQIAHFSAIARGIRIHVYFYARVDRNPREFECTSYLRALLAVKKLTTLHG